MKSIVIIRKEIIQQLRDYKMLLIMTVLPILIIMVLGLIFNQDYTSKLTLSEMSVAYSLSEESDLSKALISSLDQLQIKESLELSKSEGFERVENNELVLFIEIENESVKVYKNDTFLREGSAIESFIEQFLVRYSLSEKTEISELRSYTNLEIASGSQDYNIMNYFGISMSLLFVFYGMPMQITSVINERKDETFSRMLNSPTQWYTIIFGKIIGNILIASLQITIIMLVTLFAFGVNWGNPLISWLLLETFVILSVAIGITIGFLFNSEDKAMGFIHIFIVIMAFFGGSYMPLENIGFLGSVGKYFSPIWWTSNGLFGYIYTIDNMYYINAMTINLIGTLLLIGISSYLLNRKKEVIYV